MDCISVLFFVAVSDVTGVYGSFGRDDELGDAKAQPEQAPLSPQQVSSPCHGRFRGDLEVI